MYGNRFLASPLTSMVTKKLDRLKTGSTCSEEKNVRKNIAKKLYEGFGGELYNLIKLVTRLVKLAKKSQNPRKN